MEHTINFKHCYVEKFGTSTGTFAVEKQLLLIQHENPKLCGLAAKSLANPKTRELIY